MNWRPPLRGCHAPTRPRHSGWPDASFPAWPPWTPRPGSAVTEGATADLEDNLPSRDCPGRPTSAACSALTCRTGGRRPVAAPAHDGDLRHVNRRVAVHPSASVALTGLDRVVGRDAAAHAGAVAAADVVLPAVLEIEQADAR